MLSVEDAVSLVLANSPAPEAINMPVNGSLVGHFLAEDVEANDPVPAYRASIVDGYAVIVSESGLSTKGVFPVASVSHAAPGEISTLQRGQIARITTGAPLPPGANAVVMVEDTVLRSMTDDGQEEKVVEILTDQVKAGENIREVGSDIKAGEVVLRKGDEITAVGGELGLLASVGKAEIMVYKKPVIGVLSTGDEIVMHDRAGPLQLGEVRDCNRPTLMAAVKGWGFQVVDYGIAKDKCVPSSLFIIPPFAVSASLPVHYQCCFTSFLPLYMSPLLQHSRHHLSFNRIPSPLLPNHLSTTIPSPTCVLHRPCPTASFVIA
jgi:gephyrin